MSANDKIDQAALTQAVLAAEASSRVFRALLRSARAAGLPPEMARQCASRGAAASTGVDVLAVLGLSDVGLGFGSSQMVEAPRQPKAGVRIPNAQYEIPAFVAAWKGNHLAVPHTVCRTSELYRAYLLWCRGMDIDPIHIRNFLGNIEQADPNVSRSSMKVDGRTARLLVPGGLRRKIPMDMWAGHAAAEATRFSAALLTWESAA